MKDFRGLTVWQRAHSITLAVYRSTRTFPREEIYGISSQMRRCSSSVAANIAEGCGRRGNPEFGRFLGMAMGSASELEYFLLLARDLNYLSSSAYELIAKDVSEMRRMLNSLISKVQRECTSTSQRSPTRGQPHLANC
jgi:four helix bundle protein